MNRPNALVIEANIPAAAPITPRDFGTGKLTPAQRRECEDITRWLEEQDDAEVEFLVAELTAKHHRQARRVLGH